jgi:acetyl-CoA C-acetyltransferase
MRAATGTALGMAGLGVDDVDVFDLYSCFGSAVAFGRDALGLADDDPRPVTVTGGLAAHGGPSSNYLGHSISHLVDRLRDGRGTVGLVTGIGMHMTKHVAAVWSSEPGPLGAAPAHEDQHWGSTTADPVPVLDTLDGTVRVVAATVSHGRDGAPERAVAICEGEAGRCYATSEDPDVLAAVGSDAWAGADARLSSRPDDTNDLRL